MKRIHPAKKITGTVNLPGDKSISHRAALLGAVSVDGITAHNFSDGADCASTLSCLEKAGADIHRKGTTLSVSAPSGLTSPSSALDAGNSGTTAGPSFRPPAGKPGDQSHHYGRHIIRSSPAPRIVETSSPWAPPLTGLTEEPPFLSNRASPGATHVLETASAQVKTALLLAASPRTDPPPSSSLSPPRPRSGCSPPRNPPLHRRTLHHHGPSRPLRGEKWTIPGDFSSAAFWIVALPVLG